MSPRRRNLPTLANVKGQYLLPDNTPDHGAVSFRVYDPAVYDGEADPNTVTEAPVVAPLDGTGAFSADLAASADEGWRLDEASMTAGGMPYVITINTQGLRDSYVAYVPEGDSRLEDLVVLDWDPDVILTPGTPGPPGPEGPQGPTGGGMILIGTVATWADLPPTGNTVNDAYVIADQVGVIGVWSVAELWEHLVTTPGPEGPPGEDFPLAGQVNTQTVDNAYTFPADVEFHQITMTGDTTLTMPTGLTDDGFVFAVTLDGVFTPTWDASVEWADGTGPTYAPLALFTFYTEDAGVSWLGSYVGGAFA